MRHHMPESSSNKLARRVLLCCMPFGDILRPYLALAQLKACLTRAGIVCDVRYFCLDFAARVGSQLYDSLSNGYKAYLVQAGEWIFAQSVFGETAANPESFFNHAQEMVPEVFTSKHREEILKARQKVEPFLECCQQEIEQGKYDIIGFTLSLQQLNASLALAKHLKEANPGLITIFGGHDVYPPNGPEMLRNFSFVDYACLGEGDQVLPELICRLRDGREFGDLPGLAMRRNGEVVATGPDLAMVQDVDGLPYPDYDDYMAQFKTVTGKDWNGVLHFEASRGCQWGAHTKCTFCGVRFLPYRAKTPSRAAAEIRYLSERYKARALNATDYHAPPQLLNWFSELGERTPPPTLAFDLRPTTKKDELIQMKKAGVGAVCVGIESLSTPVLRLMNKGSTVLTNIQVMKWCRELRLVLYWNYLYGFPGEDPAEYGRMAELIPSLAHLPPPIATSPMYLLRFSPYWQEPERLGLVNIHPMSTWADVLPGIPEEARRKLAVIFDYDHADGRRPDEYFSSVKAAIGKWVDAAPASVLACVDDGERLRLFDTRPVTQVEVSVLAGPERELFLACDSQQNLKSLVKRFPDIASAEIERMLNGWLEKRWMISEMQKYLSLAADISQYLKPEQRTQTSDDFCLAMAKALMCPKPASE